MSAGRNLYLIAAAAPPVRQLAGAAARAAEMGWQPHVVLTPTAASWVDIDQLSATTGSPIRVHPRLPHEQDPLPEADAVLAAPLTFNTINKWAAGISDTLALGLLNELLSGSVPIVAAPCVKADLRSHPAYPKSVAMLADAGVHMLDPDSISARGGDGLVAFDWHQVLGSLSAD